MPQLPRQQMLRSQPSKASQRSDPLSSQSQKNNVSTSASPLLKGPKQIPHTRLLLLRAHQQSRGELNPAEFIAVRGVGGFGGQRGMHLKPRSAFESNPQQSKALGSVNLGISQLRNAPFIFLRRLLWAMAERTHRVPVRHRPGAPSRADLQLCSLVRCSRFSRVSRRRAKPW